MHLADAFIQGDWKLFKSWCIPRVSNPRPCCCKHHALLFELL